MEQSVYLENHEFCFSLLNGNIRLYHVNGPTATERRKKSKWRSKRMEGREEFSLHGQKNDKDIHSEYKLVQLHDFLTDVKDWVFYHLQLNLDKKGLFRGKKSLNVSSLSSVRPHTLPPFSLSLSLFISFNLSLLVFPSTLLSFCLPLQLADKALVAHFFWTVSPWGSDFPVCFLDSNMNRMDTLLLKSFKKYKINFPLRLHKESIVAFPF